MDPQPTAPEQERIPDDVVEDILVRLPVKPLIRFKCVSRSLYSKIANPEFITKHFNLIISSGSSDNNNGYLLRMPRVPSGVARELSAVVWNSDGSLTEISRFRIPFFRKFIGFCNGIFCCTLFPEVIFKRGLPHDYDIDSRLRLWNPSIGKFKIIEPMDEDFGADAYGFAFHSQNNDFKILKIGRFINDGNGVPSSEGLLAQVYTLSINSWSWLELQDITDIKTSPCLFFNGALHCIACSQNRKLILCFDVHDHNFREIILPQGYSNGLSLKFERLAIFKGSLALIAFGLDEDAIEVCRIWTMKEYRLVESWTQTNVVLLPDVDEFFGCTGSGKLVITRKPDQLFSFDLDSQNENNLGIEDLAPVEGFPPLEDPVLLG